MVKVQNGRIIRRLSVKSFWQNRTRNIIAVLAIALTTVMFTSLFTIGITIMHSYEEETFRQVGGDMHGTFKDIPEDMMLELAEDPLIVKTAARLLLGMPTDPPFNKAHVEVGYMDAACAEGYFCTPEQGALPAEGTKQIACDSRILKLLGITDPKVGDEVNLSYYLGFGGTQELVSDTFTLSGWWEYDPASMASQAIVPRSYAEQMLEGYERQDDNDSTGTWQFNVYLKSTAHIEDDLKQILANHGYQADDPQADNYVKIGVNWAYIGTQVASSVDPTMVIAIAALLILIIFTGYLIIYNIFQISVSADIRFYGLLKTIGTTPRQIRRMVRYQALFLSLMGIPIGLIIGYVTGNLLTPVIMRNLSYSISHATVNPIIFIGAAAFSLVTVLFSCRRPGRIAGRVSPVEAVRYTEGGNSKKKFKKSRNGGRVWRMALSNLGRNKKKTVLVMLSLSLAVVLLEMTSIFTIGFDMDKYLRNWVVSDFILGDARYFQTTGELFSADSALPEEAIAAVQEQGGITEGGRIYGSTKIQEFVPEEWFRENHGRWGNDEETLTQWIETLERADDGKVADDAQIYGMEKYPLDQLNVLEGDLAPLYDPSRKAIAAVYGTDDYGKPKPGSHWAKVGDKVTLRYVDRWEYYDTRTGEVMEPDKIEEGFVGYRAAEYHEETYTVAALVNMRHSMSYRYYVSDEYVLNADAFKADSGQENIMTYLYDTTEESVGSMEDFLKDYTENVDAMLDYESKASYVAEFESFRGMFVMLGGVLSFIIGLVGVLNFLNAVLTGIISRKREFAVLQSVGMTGRQLGRMLAWEGLFYTGGSLLFSMLLSLCAIGPAMSQMERMFWFFTSRMTITPILILLPVFLLLGAGIPLLAYQSIKKQSLVERLRGNE